MPRKTPESDDDSIMRYYPIFLDLHARRCLVIGGGTVAERKVGALLQAGGLVTVISPTLTAQLQSWSARGEITTLLRPYRPGDIAGFAIAFAATNDEDLHQRLAEEARAANVWLNVVDRPAWCSFIVPALVSQGDLTVAISTGGTSPAMAKKIREDLELQFGPEYALTLTLLAGVREMVANAKVPPAERQRLFTALAASPLLEYVRERKVEQVDAVLRQTVGPHCTCATLGVTL